jgi:hypothetical protein
MARIVWSPQIQDSAGWLGASLNPNKGLVSVPLVALPAQLSIMCALIQIDLKKANKYRRLGYDFCYSLVCAEHMYANSSIFLK